MRPTILVDTGPLVAVLDQKDRYHQWAVDQFKAFPPPFYTCEAVLTEASHIVYRNGFDPDVVLELVNAGSVVPDFDLREHSVRVQALMQQYRDRPMDLADACLVRMAERDPESHVLSVDSDFFIYRKHGNEAIAVIHPFS